MKISDAQARLAGLSAGMIMLQFQHDLTIDCCAHEARERRIGGESALDKVGLCISSLDDGMGVGGLGDRLPSPPGPPPCLSRCK